MPDAEQQEVPACVTVMAIRYRVKCTAPGCRNVARTILRYADGGGRPLSNLGWCNAHTREAIERDAKAGLTTAGQELR